MESVAGVESSSPSGCSGRGLEDSAATSPSAVVKNGPVQGTVRFSVYSNQLFHGFLNSSIEMSNIDACQCDRQRRGKAGDREETAMLT